MTITCPNCGEEFTPGQGELDGRTARWQVRVRLYPPGKADEPEADSDPDIAPDQPGATVIAGLPGVAKHLAALATDYHSADVPVTGLEEGTLRHRLKGLRPTLSRRGGDAVWRVHYKAGAQEWLARVDIKRVQAT